MLLRYQSEKCTKSRRKEGHFEQDNYTFAGGDALRGHTRSHPEHDG